MGTKLVIVESPAKANTIQKYLGKDYEVLSSVGHIRDLATSGPGGLGVDVENKFEPNYTVISGKQKVITELKKHAKKAETIYLATDPDREGEAISWHLYDALALEKEKDKTVYRVVFHEITKNAILEAIKNPRQIDDHLVRSQESRRILDRIIGFKLSKLLQSKIKSKSAGRVQSVALKMIVDREREIEAFIIEEYYSIEALFKKSNKTFEASYVGFKDKKIDRIASAEEADAILAGLGDTYQVVEIDQKERQRHSKPPFITSTLQQEASSKLNFTAKKTMTLAQKLYEGIEINGEPHGLISYMRTDSIRLSDEFVSQTFAYINGQYGKGYTGAVKKDKKAKTKNVQDAHEAIRPTDINRTPESVKKYLTSDLYKLYKLIYARALASLMAAAKFDQTGITIENNGYQFKANGQVLIFDGYLKVYEAYETNKDNELPLLEKSEIVLCENVDKVQHFTQPPARYTEAKLIREMEELGIGRPSTYSQTMDTLKGRHYVTLDDKKFAPTEQGVLTSDELEKYFSAIINPSYTAKLEEDLDDIANGEKVWHEELNDFYQRFTPLLEHAQENMEKIPPKLVGEDCPDCGQPLVERIGRYGPFVGCSGYPECKFIKKEETNEEPLEKLDILCPKCKVGHFVERVTKKGRYKGSKFYACDNFPKCKNIVVGRPVDQACPECENILTDKAGEIICENKECSYGKPVNEETKEAPVKKTSTK